MKPRLVDVTALAERVGCSANVDPDVAEKVIAALAELPVDEFAEALGMVKVKARVWVPHWRRKNDVVTVLRDVWIEAR